MINKIAKFVQENKISVLSFLISITITISYILITDIYELLSQL